VTDILLSHTVSELSQLIIQILDTAYLSLPPGGLQTTYDVHLGLIGKRVFPFSVNRTSSLGVTAEAPYERK